MINQLLGKFFEAAGPTVVKRVQTIGKAIAKHFAKHGTKYTMGAGGVVAAGGAYAVGQAQGHKKGKVEGTVEQAVRDEKKIHELNEAHEQDRRKWENEKNDYETLLDEVEKQM